MSRPLRHLPVIQQWDCHGCTNCCRDHRVFLDEAESQRIAAMEWTGAADLAGPTVIHERGRAHLQQRADGCCVFLSDQGRCRIHEKYGSAAKPFACRLYPFVLIPVADHWRVGVRFSCPSAARNEGRPLPEHEAALRDLAAELSRREGIDGRPVPAPPLQPGQELSGPDVLRLTAALGAILDKTDEPLERRWRKCLALSALCRQARFDQVQGARLDEFLAVLIAGLDAEVSADAAALAPPSWVGRILFRQLLAVYLRKDGSPERGPAARNRLTLLGSAWRFARGRGAVPRLNTLLPETTFARIEEQQTPLSDAARTIFDRYYRVKLAALQFCGPANFGLQLWQGLDSLALTLPVLFWLLRAFADQPAEEAAVRAVRLVDHNFGYSPHLGARLQRTSLGILARRGEIERLITWYSR
jgi:lysine-N-methylase